MKYLIPFLFLTGCSVSDDTCLALREMDNARATCKETSEILKASSYDFESDSLSHRVQCQLIFKYKNVKTPIFFMLENIDEMKLVQRTAILMRLNK